MPVPQPNSVLLPNTVQMTELVLARSIGVFSLLLVALALPDLLQDTGGPAHVWYTVIVVLIPVLVVAVMVPTQRQGLRRIFAGTVAWLLLVGFLLWHLGLIGNSLGPDARPWSWGIAGAGVGLAAVAKNTRMASLYGFCFTLLVLLIPAMPAGSSRAWADSWQDALLTAAMTAVIVAPIWALRQAVQESESAAVTALEKFAAAARSEAITVERMRLDALTHDIVLSTLIVASQAVTPEVVAASRKTARLALAQMDAVGEATSVAAELTIAEWLGRMRVAVSLHGGSFDVPPPGSQAPASLSLVAGRAIVEATTEAVKNSIAHAPGSLPAVTVFFPASQVIGKPQVAVEIADNGPGFDVADIAMERMGIKVSIVERMLGVQGKAAVTSSPSTGTLVRLEWSTDGGHHGSAQN